MRRLPPLLLALAILVAPHAARAARLLGVPARAAASTSVDVRWQDLPAGTFEVELEISLDGGPWERASAEHEALEGHLAWRVPAGRGHRAVLRLRAGSEHGECEVARSEEFVIAPAGRTPLPVDALQGARVPFHGCAPLTGRLGAASYRLHLECDAEAESELRVSSAPAPPAGELLALNTKPRAPGPTTSPASHVIPAFRPLRN